MEEADDRLAGDPVWELFPAAVPAAGNAHARGPSGIRAWGRWLAAGALVAVCWFLVPAAAVVLACVAVAARDFRVGRQLAQSISDKAGGRVCARFTYAWGAWKFAWAGFVLMFVSVTSFTAVGKNPNIPPEFLAAMLLCLGGFAASTAWTAAGLVAAYRSGMRVWVGEGVNQARTLLLGMLIVAFTFVVVGPFCIWMSWRFPVPSNNRPDGLTFVLVLVGCMFAGPVFLLLVLDRICRRVLADRPGKFGPKVPTVGKW
jgi:hypothetical protein